MLISPHSNNLPLSPPAASAWIRRTLADSIRSRNPFAVNLLLGGFDTTTSLPHLYWIDYLGTKAVVPYAAHGLGVYVSLSTMDKYWYEGIEREEALDVLRKCIAEAAHREFSPLFNGADISKGWYRTLAST
jgi:20S proteasome subunit beta 4